MATTKAKTSRNKKPAIRRKALVAKREKGFSQPYDARKFAGTVAAFANITAEEMQAWRDDR